MNPFQKRPYLISRLLEIDPKRLKRLFSENHVFQDGQGANQHEMLVNHADPKGNGIMGITDVDFFPSNENFSAVGVVKAVENPHERRFPSPVFSDEAVNLLFMDDKRNR